MRKFFLLSLLSLFFVACSVDEDPDLLKNQVDNVNSVVECYAGPDSTGTVTKSYLDEEVEDIGQVEQLFLDLLDEKVATDGTFNPTMDELLIEYREDPTGDFTTTYTVGEDDCEDSTELTLVVVPCENSAGADNSRTVTKTFLNEEIEDIGQVEQLYLDLLDEGVATNGTFSPNMEELLIQYRENPEGDFTTTYTVGEGDCQDSAELTLTIESCEVSAGADNSETVSKIFLDEEVEDIGQVEQLFQDLLDEDVPTDGIYEPSMEELLIQYRENPEGEFKTTYTVGEGDCQDSCELTLAVVPCDISGLSDNSETITSTYLNQEVEDKGEIKQLYLDLLDESVATDGTFNPTVNELLIEYREDPTGDFTTTYTVGNGECEASAELTLTVIDNES